MQPPRPPARKRPARLSIPAPRYTPWSAALLALLLSVIWLSGLGLYLALRLLAQG